MAKRSEWIHAPEHFTPAEIPIAGRMISMIMSLVTLSVLAVCLIRRIQNINNWSKLPITLWLVIVIYVDSYIFVFITAVFKDYGVNASFDICQGAILLCLACYLTTKVLIYIFLVEKAYIIRGSTKPRMKDPLYLFNCFGMLLPYGVVAIINFVWRISYINDNGVCIIGMERKALLPLIVFDVIVNVYLTVLFLLPLRCTSAPRCTTEDHLLICPSPVFVQENRRRRLQYSPSYGVQDLHRRLCDSHLQHRQPDRADRPAWRARLDLPHALQRRQ